MTTPTHSHKAWTDKGGHVKYNQICLAKSDLRDMSKQISTSPHPTLFN